MSESPFHAGERRVQARMGVHGIEAWARRVVRDFMPEEHREFYAALPFMVAAARDARGRPWVTLLARREGVASSPEPKVLELWGGLPGGDALGGALTEGVDLGLLGIEFTTRRRNRVNGRVGRAPEGIRVEVEQSFGNCPQYIRERGWRWVEEDAGAPARSGLLSRRQQGWIRGADTFFIASGFRGEGERRSYGMDASHRGGEAGFVEVLGPGRLRFPDYSGNNHFNTIGNLSMDPRVGLLFVDFATGSLLQVSGRASIDWGSPAVERVAGARRLVTIEVEAVVELPRAVGLRWEVDAESVRSLEVVERVDESAGVTSFVFAARDGGALPAFVAGQHLPIEVPASGPGGAPLRRTYSLSGSPRAARYRITVKREARGRASSFLHDQVGVGSILSARRPAGDFVLDHDREGAGAGGRPVVLVSAGVGVTPMVAMAHELVASGSPRPLIFIHGARDGRHHPLAGELTALAERAGGRMSVRVAYSRPRPEDSGRYDRAGRIDGASVRGWVTERSGEAGAAGADYYLCGPTAFMAEVQKALVEGGTPEERVHAETFGASSGAQSVARARESKI